MSEKSVVQERTAYTMDHENEARTQSSVALDLALKPCEDTEAIYPKRLGHY